MWAHRASLSRLLSNGVVRCENRDDDGLVQNRGVVFVTSNSSGRDVRTMIAHLHAAGLHDLTEVRRLSQLGSSRSCARDRRMHQFVEEIINGGCTAAPLLNFEYRCLDFIDSPEPDALDNVMAALASQAVDFIAVLPDCFEDLVPLTDRLATRLGATAIANNPETSHWRIDKFAMQEAVARFSGLGARQVSVGSAAEVPAAMTSGIVEYPVIVKPVASSASDGVFLCHNESALLEAVQQNLASKDIFQRPNQRVVIQEQLRGEEFVVNTVSLHGQHRVVDMWEAHKELRGERILYGHQWLVLDSSEHADVVNFCLSVLDAVGLAGGAAHLEVVRTPTGVRLIEINPRPAGHAPRALAVMGESQFSVLAQAVARPSEFTARSLHCRAQVPRCVAVGFLIADQDAEVHRRHLLMMIELETFQRFDRTAVPMFAEAVHRAESESFWIAACTRGLFSVPLAVVLEGAEEAVRRDLRRVREIEAEMYQSFGHHEPGFYAGSLEGGDPAAWTTQALAKVALPPLSSCICALPGARFRGEGGLEYYRSGDLGVVTNLTDDRIFVTWERSGLVTSIGKLAWGRFFELVELPPEDFSSTGPSAALPLHPGAAGDG